MNDTSLVGRWANWAPQLMSVLRIAAALMFLLYGSMKILAFPAGIPPDGLTAPLFTEVWLGGMLELVGGVLMLLGLFTRPTAFILAGEMAVAYFQFHFPSNFWPVLNGGATAALYCWVWLYFSSAGAGPWSLDALRKR